MNATDISYDVDGSTMIGRLALPRGDGPAPAVLIAHEGNGLDDFQRSRADRLAELGYVAFALDYHGGGQPLADRADMNERLTRLYDDPQRALALANAGLDILLAQPRTDPSSVAAIGYCFGGRLVLELARRGADLKAVVGFHPDLTTEHPRGAADVVGKVLVCVGADDPFVPLEQRLAFEDEMRAAGVEWQLHLYGGVKHSFTHPRADLAGVPGIEYHAPSDARSWRAMLELFAEVLVAHPA